MLGKKAGRTHAEEREKIARGNRKLEEGEENPKKK